MYKAEKQLLELSKIKYCSVKTRTINTNLFYKGKELVAVIDKSKVTITDIQDYAGTWKAGKIVVGSTKFDILFKNEFNEDTQTVNDDVYWVIANLKSLKDREDKTKKIMDLLNDIPSVKKETTKKETKKEPKKKPELQPTEFPELTNILIDICKIMEPFSALLNYPFSKKDVSKLYTQLKPFIERIIKGCVTCKMKQIGNIYIYPYFQNFYYLMYCNFVIELYCIICFASISDGLNFYDGSETITQSEKCECIFSHHDSCNRYRYYKNKLKGSSIVEIFNDFTRHTSNIFSNFVSELIKDVSRGESIPENRVRECIFVTGSNTIDINWKSNLAKIGVPINICNAHFHRCMNSFQDEEMSYNAEGMGFMSYTFLTNTGTTDYSQMYGSCITYSCMELYIMSRMMINPQNISLRLELEGGKHPYWIHTQAYLDVHLSHWATQVVLSKQPDRKSQDIKETYKYRSALPKLKETLVLDLQYKKKLIMKALLFPIFDSYNVLFKKCKSSRTTDNEAKQLNNDLNSAFTQYEKHQISIIKHYMETDKVIDSNSLEDLQVPMINQNYDIMILGKPKSYNMLYSASLKGDIAMVTFLCKVYGVDLESVNQNNNTCVHAAVLGIPGANGLKRIECLKVLKTALGYKWYNMTVAKNNAGETPKDCIQYGNFSKKESEQVVDILKTY